VAGGQLQRGQTGAIRIFIYFLCVWYS